MKKFNGKNLKNAFLSFAVFGFGLALVGAGNHVVANANDTQTPTATEYLMQAEMMKGAAIRLGEKTGIRFGFVMDETAYADFTATYEAKFGVLIAPSDYKTQYGAFSEATVFGNGEEENNPKVYDWAVEQADGSFTYEDKGYTRIINLVYDQMTEREDDEIYQDKMTCYGSILDVLPANLAREFMSIGYIEYTPKAGGETEYYFLSENDNSRSMAYVAQLRIADPESDSAEEADLYQKYIKPVETTATSYTVESYLVGEETPFNTAVVNDVTVNQAVTVTPAAFDGYEFDADNALNSATAVTVLANGKLTVKYYYTQKSATLEVANDGTVTFDNLGASFSYDLYVNGALAAEDVVSGETNVYTDKIVTVTGVYQAQLVVTMEDGEEFARSAEVKFATGFLNENEIYSFDNNYAAAGTVHGNVKKEVQSAVTHNDSAYALKVTSSGSGARITLDLSERRLEKNARISYWIYVVKPEGATGDTTGSRTNVPQGFEGTLGRFTRTYSESGSSTVPYETWTKMYTYVHGNTSRLDLFCFAWDCPVENYVFYMDDIYVEEMDYETGDGIYNMVLTSDNGGHFTFTSEQYGSDIAVGDEVDVTMKIKVSTTEVGTDYGFFTVKVGGEEKTIANKSSYSTEWKEVSFRVTVTPAQANLKKWQMDFAEGISLVWMNTSLVMDYITMKDVTFTKYVPAENPADTADITLTAETCSGGAGPAVATKILPVADDVKAGATVKVTMTVALSAANDYTRFHTVKGSTVDSIVYGFASSNAAPQLAALKSGEYSTFTFEATVVENQSFTYHGAATPATGKGVAILCVSLPAAGNFVWIKDVQIEAPLSASADYTYKTTKFNSEMNYSTHMYLDVDDSLAVGQKVTVTLTVLVESPLQKSWYANFRTFNPDKYPAASSIEVYGDIATDKTPTTFYQWHTITFTTVVVDSATSWAWSSQGDGSETHITEKCVWFAYLNGKEGDTIHLKDITITPAN